MSLLHQRTGFLYVFKCGYAHGASRGGMFGGIRGDETMVIQAPGDQLLFPCTGAQVLCISYVVINKCRKVRSPLHKCTPASLQRSQSGMLRSKVTQGELSIHMVLIV